MEPSQVIENLAMIRRNFPEMAATLREAQRMIEEREGDKRLIEKLQAALNREVARSKSQGV